MNLRLTLSKRADHTKVELAFDCMGSRISCSVVGSIDDVTNTVTNFLIWAYTRKADLFVSTGMDLLRQSKKATMEGVVDQLAHVVIALDTASLYIKEANDLIRSKTPGMLHLVGKNTWSGYPSRRKEFDDLTALAELINERVVHPENNSCPVCLFPMTTTCARCVSPSA